MTFHVTLDHEAYHEARESFTWDIPEAYNIAVDLVRKHPNTAGRVALYQLNADGSRDEFTFRELDNRSNQLARAFSELGIQRGDRVGVVVPQKPANPLVHLACWKIGAISLPLSVLFGHEGLTYRLADSGAKAAVVDTSILETVMEAEPACPDLEHIIAVDGTNNYDVIPFETLGKNEPTDFEIAETTWKTPAVIMYTSGSTGPPKGALHGHGVWLGHCPAFYMYFEQDVTDAVFWTPADWAWIGALGDLVFPAWHYGRPIVGHPMGSFEPEQAYSILETFDVTNAFIPPTAIRMMMDVDPASYSLSLQAICSGGEPLTPEIITWADQELEGVVVNELYGQTEANLLVTNCQRWFDIKPGSMGKPVPGHDVVILDQESGEPVPTGDVGEIAVRKDADPVIFQEYWKSPEKTEASHIGNWHLTGDLGYQDDDGYLWFKSRNDDLINTSGYRVGPGEVESTILEHPDVEQVGVIGKPDDTRGEIIKAFVQPVAGVTGSGALRDELQQLVREQLAKHEYPREIEFRDALPQTTTGKIQRKSLRESEPSP